MSLGLIGTKCGMTRQFEADGTSVPLTVIKIESNKIVQIKRKQTDGYNSLQIAYGEKKPGRITKPLAGHYAKANQTAGKLLHEFRVNEDVLEGKNVGDEITTEIFSIGQKVSVQGKTIGKGFACGIKRHNFSMQDATHGNSVSHRVLGSIGMNQTPGRVFKGKKMAGHLGNVKCTIENLTIHSIDAQRSIIMVKGSVPGHAGSDVIITTSKKQ